ncbi:MAG: hypothetical protein QOH66_2987 [Actinomycetota bacterium]|nr:hypothetical protein [Actinomycetota bacterium]
MALREGKKRDAVRWARSVRLGSRAAVTVEGRLQTRTPRLDVTTTPECQAHPKHDNGRCPPGESNTPHPLYESGALFLPVGVGVVGS